MTTPAISWPELWSIYRRSPEPVQQELLRQLNLTEILSYASKRVKKEILDEAPDEITHVEKVGPVNPNTGMTQEQLMKKLFPDPNKPMEYWLKQGKHKPGLLDYFIRR